MDEVIKNLCEVLKAEAEAVKGYTDLMKRSSSLETIQTFTVNRIQAVVNIQKLTMELSNRINDEASKMMEVQHETE